MQALLSRFTEELLAGNFLSFHGTHLFYRATEANTLFFIDFNPDMNSIEIVYGIVPSLNDLGLIAAIHDCSRCLKFSCKITAAPDLDTQLADVKNRLRRFYAEYSSSTPGQLESHVSARRRMLYSIVTEILRPYDFVPKPSHAVQIWSRRVSPDVSIEFRIESSPALRHNGLICVRDSRDPDAPRLYWRNAHVDGVTHFYWESINEEIIYRLTRNALNATILPLLHTGMDRLLADDAFKEENGWNMHRSAPPDTPLFRRITDGLQALGMAKSEKYGNRFCLRINGSQAYIANAYDSSGNILVIYGLKHDAHIFDDGVDWLAQVGGASDSLQPSGKAVISNAEEADSLIRSIRAFMAENPPRTSSLFRIIRDFFRKFIRRRDRK